MAKKTQNLDQLTRALGQVLDENELRVLLKRQLAIAKGEKVKLEGTNVKTLEPVYEETPSIAESQKAAELLLAYRFGKPASIPQPDAAKGGTEKRKWNPDALSMDEFAELNRISRKAHAGDDDDEPVN